MPRRRHLPFHGYDKIREAYSLKHMNNIVSSFSRIDPTVHVRADGLRRHTRRSMIDTVPSIRISVGNKILNLIIEADDMALAEALRSALPSIEAALPMGYCVDVSFVGQAKSKRSQEKSHGSGLHLHELTARQREVLELLAKGLSNKQIARQLSLSHFTVRNHISQIMRLFEVSTRQDVVASFASLNYQASPVLEF